MDITYSIFSGAGMKSDQTTGKALRRLTAEQVVEYLSRSTHIGTDLGRFTIVSTAGDRIPGDWFLEDNQPPKRWRDRTPEERAAIRRDAGFSL